MNPNDAYGLDTILRNSQSTNEPRDVTGAPFPERASRVPSYLGRLLQQPVAAALRPAAEPVAQALYGMSPPMAAAASGVVDAAERPSFARMRQYMDKYRSAGVRDFTEAPPPENADDFLARLAMRESMGNSKAVNQHTRAGGLFQYIPTTWGGHAGFSSASEAPEEVQYNRAMHDMMGSLQRNKGDVARYALEHYMGPTGAMKALKDTKHMFVAPGEHNGGETPYKRISALLGAPQAATWLTQHQEKVADIKNSLNNLYSME